MKKIVLVLLSVLLVLATLISCSDNPETSTPKITTPKLDDTPEIPDDTEENKNLNIDIDSIDYDNQMITVFHWQPARTDVTISEFGMELEEIQNDAVNDAVYQRNLRTERDLGIDLDWVEQSGSTYWKTRNFIDRLDARLANPDTPVDIIAGCIRSMPFFMMEGYLTELNTYSDSLDFTKAWWPENIQDAIAIRGNLYFASGDIAASVLQNMTVLYANKTRLEAIGQSYEGLMQKVLAYEWTIDDLISLTQNEYADIDNVKGPSESDRFGLTTLYFYSDGLYTGLGYKYMIESTKEGEYLRLASNLATETSMQYVQKIKDWQLDNDFFMKYTDAQEDTYQKTFKEGLALFALDRGALGFELQETDIKYACLPAPTIDGNQDRYYTNVNSSYTGYGICKQSIDYDIAAQTLQVLGYHAYSTTTPTIFEVSFQGKFAKDDYTIQMFNIIRESIVFDTGKVYDVFVATQIDGFVLPDFLESIVANVLSYGIKGNEYGEDTNFNFPSMSDPVRNKVQKCIDSANKKIGEFLDSEE